MLSWDKDFTWPLQNWAPKTDTADDSSYSLEDIEDKDIDLFRNFPLNDRITQSRANQDSIAVG